MLPLLKRYGGILKGGLAALFVIIVLGAILLAYFKGHTDGVAYTKEKAAQAQIEATNAIREEERKFYKDQINVLRQLHHQELELEKANVKIKEVIKTKYITKEKACESDGALSNDYVQLYNDSIHAANGTSKEGDSAGVTKTVSEPEVSKKQ